MLFYLIVEVAVTNCRSKPHSYGLVFRCIFCIVNDITICHLQEIVKSPPLPAVIVLHLAYSAENKFKLELVMYHNPYHLPGLYKQLRQSSTRMIIRQFEINNIRQLVTLEIKCDCCKPEVV